MSFADFSLSPELARSIKDRGHHQPTPIQSGAIPIAMQGRDLIATAETGSGKTSAYLIPLIERLLAQPPDEHHRPEQPAEHHPEHRAEDHDGGQQHSERNHAGGQRHRGRHHPGGIRAMVLVPTRELAAQVAKEFGILARNTRLRAALIVGGDSMNRQLHELRNGANVLVACPGRLNDHIERGTVKLANLEVAVLDEADRMLDMGFLPQIRRIMRTVPAKRQTLMFSATMGSGVAQVAREFLKDPEHVAVNDKAAPPPSIHQTIYPVTNDNKGPMLIEILKRDDVESAIVFTRTRSRADRVARMLARSGIKAVAIHGDRSQSQRNAALAGFRNRTFRVMVATDVAARGLDIPDVSHVINYDLPDESENYIHRIGRTARMGKSGEALSLVTPEERVTLGRLERTLGKQLERETVEGFEAPQITAPKPVTLFRSSKNSRRSRPRARWA